MIQRLDNVKWEVRRAESDLVKVAQKQLKKPVKYFKILKKSLDARDKSHIFWLYSIAFSGEEEQEPEKTFEKISGNPRVVVVGSGPAGLFCTLRLIQHGFQPILLERGECVEEREKTTQKFFTEHILDVNSNIQFGEGGAGTFSDGKINTQTKDSLNRDVLELFHAFGAPDEILYLNKPHIGSDKLKTVVKNMRQYILQQGGQVLFRTQFVDFSQQDGAITGVKIRNVATGEESELQADSVVLALGHSARDTFDMLAKRNVAMEAREFAVGVRIEHLNAEISRAQYGKSFALLPAADYKLVSHAHERTVFTFCMCPGGVVIPAASEEGGVVVNGMSDFARDGVNSNSALMVQMRREDFGADDLFAGMRFQREIERKAFEAGGRDYKAPVQRYGDFAKNKVTTSFGSVKPTYAAGTTFAPLHEILPKVTVQAMQAAIPDMNKRLAGFANPDALLTGVETRFSSPVRIVRDQTCQSVSVKNLYPCGEGSGYSGGITSSAADGLKIAEILYQKYSK